MSIRVAGRGGFSRTNYEKLYDVTLTAAGDFDLTNIPPSFAHLFLLLDGFRGDANAPADVLYLMYNGDATAAKYRSTRHDVGGGVDSISETDTPTICTIPSLTADANQRSSMGIWVYGYSFDGYMKLARCTNQERRTAAALTVQDVSLSWEDASIINRIQIQTDNDPTDQILSDARIQLFGVR